MRSIWLSAPGVCIAMIVLFISGCGFHNNDDETRVVGEINNMRIILARLSELAIQNQDINDLDALLSILQDDNARQNWIKSDKIISYKIAPDIMQWRNYLTSQAADAAVYCNISQINNGRISSI